MVVWSSNLPALLDDQERAELTSQGLLTFHGPEHIRDLAAALKSFFDDQRTSLSRG